MTVICVLLRQSRCGLLNYIGGRGASSQLALAAYFVGESDYRHLAAKANQRMTNKKIFTSLRGC